MSLPRCMTLIVVAAVAVVVAATHSVAAADSATVNATAAPAPSTLEPWMTCMRVNSVGDVCDVQSVCGRCVRTPGCAFDTLVRECVALPDNGRALYASSTNPLLNRTDLHYCADGDARCTTCTVSSSNPFCIGTDGACVCPSMCMALRSTQLACYAVRQSNMMYISVAVMGVALPLLVWIHRFFTRARHGGTINDGDVRAELRRMREQRRLELARQRERERTRPASALALQLDSWRSHRDEHKVEIDKVEPLKTCYVLMDTSEPGEAATSGQSRRVGGSPNTSMDEMSAGGPAEITTETNDRGENDGNRNSAPVRTVEPSRGATTAL